MEREIYAHYCRRCNKEYYECLPGDSMKFCPDCQFEYKRGRRKHVVFFTDTLPDKEVKGFAHEVNARIRLADFIKKASLTRRQKKILALRIKDYSFREIAEKLGFSKQNSFSIYQRAVYEIRKCSPLFSGEQ